MVFFVFKIYLFKTDIVYNARKYKG